MGSALIPPQVPQKLHLTNTFQGLIIIRDKSLPHELALPRQLITRTKTKTKIDNWLLNR